MHVTIWKITFSILHRPNEKNYLKKKKLHQKNKRMPLKIMFLCDFTCKTRLPVLFKLKQQLFFSSVSFRHISYDLHSLLPFSGIDLTSW